MSEAHSLADRLLNGDMRALARAITLIEDELLGFKEVLDMVIPKIGKAHRVGITGPPGAGKSSLVTVLVQKMVAEGLTVGIVACDPSSPFTGGSLLGDRIRMNPIALLNGVFIRSMAARGSMGGIAARTMDVMDVLDAFGKDVIITETVGVGQSELQVMDAADTVVVVLVPESGDAIQTMKAGLMEIAHIFAVNKADREGADREARELKLMLELRQTAPDAWQIPVVKTIAINHDGIDELAEHIRKHRSFIKADSNSKNALDHIIRHILRAVEEGIYYRINEQLTSEKLYKEAEAVRYGHSRLSQVVTELIKSYCRS